MSNAPPSDALSEGSYWIAELSGVPAGVAIDHLSEPPFTWGKLYGAQWIAKKEANLRSTALGFKNWDELLVALHGLNGISMAKWKSVIGTSFAFNDAHYFSAQDESLYQYKDIKNRIWYERSSDYQAPSLPASAASCVPGQPPLQNPAARFYRAASEAPRRCTPPQPETPQPPLPPPPPRTSSNASSSSGYGYHSGPPGPSFGNFDAPPRKRTRQESYVSDEGLLPVKEEIDDDFAASASGPSGTLGNPGSSGQRNGSSQRSCGADGQGPGAPTAAGGGLRHLFVQGLPFNYDWRNVKDLFRSCGPVIRADIVRSREGISGGEATVMFESPVDARRALESFDGYMLYGAALKVTYDRFTPIISAGYSGPSGSGAAQSARGPPGGEADSRREQGSARAASGPVGASRGDSADTSGASGQGGSSTRGGQVAEIESAGTSTTFYRGNKRDQRPNLVDGRIHLINIPHDALPCGADCSVDRLVNKLVALMPSIRPLDIAHISVHDISDEGLSMAISLANNNLTGQLSTAQRRALGGNARDTLFRQLHLPIPLSSTAYRRQQSQSRYG